MNKKASYVTGKPGAYEIQVPIEHPVRCRCARCRALPPEEHATTHTYRIRRRSPFPSNKTETAQFARRVIDDEADKLRALNASVTTVRPMTLRELVALYFETNPRMVSAATLERDRISARNLCRLISDDARPDQLDEPVIVRYRNERLKQDARPRTVLNELVFLRGLLQFGLAWQSETGMQGIRFVKVPDVGAWDSDGVALSREEFRRVLAVVSDVNRRRMIFGVATMLRRTPLLALQGQWIDSERRWLSIPAEMMKKGRARRRAGLEVPLANWALEQVADLTPNEYGYLWPTPATGRPLVRTDHIFRDAAADADVRPFSCHDLRTTGATWLREAGVDELVIALVLGHKSTFDPASASFHTAGMNVTQSYTRVYERSLREAVAVFDRIRDEIDPRTTERANESELESGSLAGELTGCEASGYLVAHTGFEPVLPP